MKPGGQRRKGHDFERQVANDLREIYDPPELVAAIRAAKPAERPALLKRSLVRRGEQGHGALEPDVVTPTTWWIECGNGATVDPLKKLLQAKQDAPRGRRAVAVVHRKGARRCTATLSLGDLATAVSEASDAGLRAELLTCTIGYEDWLALLRSARMVAP